MGARGAWRPERWAAVLVLALATLIAALGARPYAGGWNDGSRLATVEALVDHGTFVIDRSIFLEPVPHRPAGPQPYGVGHAGGTLDRLFIRGHFYSDKPPVLSVLLAGEYWLAQRLTGLTARARPDRFCYCLTLASSGLAYVAAVWCLFLAGGRLGLALPLRLLLAASLALATVALPYGRHVNPHVCLLAVAAALTLALHDLASGERTGPRQLAVVGCLAGLGYTLDAGVGPVMLVCIAGLVAWRGRSLRPLCWFGLGALPWLALHHALNYAIGGTLGPAARVAAYFQWPGSPFDPRVNPSALTGGWNHGSAGECCVYALELLVGNHGFLGHNLPLWLALPTLVLLVRDRVREWPELVAGAAWMAGSWLLYAVGSDNYSGQCCSIRWFVPFLAPGFYCLAVALRVRPETWRSLALLSMVGGVMAALMWRAGPGMARLIPGHWGFVLAAGLAWGLLAWRERPLRNWALAPITSAG